ncbi:hypothetical protein L596_021497 [Steinernema carpocapsae]|uniref:F-box associated domain-containing protein n=1 Tax=Steinernema carpocapsae TaxID=34508 RepID=A0A4U5MJ02_STECR|nr:hypothetical protein L596_021497 [Steinernema carpocapsae]
MHHVPYLFCETVSGLLPKLINLTSTDFLPRIWNYAINEWTERLILVNISITENSNGWFYSILGQDSPKTPKLDDLIKMDMRYLRIGSLTVTSHLDPLKSESLSDQDLQEKLLPLIKLRTCDHAVFILHGPCSGFAAISKQLATVSQFKILGLDYNGSETVAFLKQKLRNGFNCHLNLSGSWPASTKALLINAVQCRKLMSADLNFSNLTISVDLVKAICEQWISSHETLKIDFTGQEDLNKEELKVICPGLKSVNCDKLSLSSPNDSLVFDFSVSPVNNFVSSCDNFVRIYTE